jgi:malonyl-CoA O-methyltransferase
MTIKKQFSKYAYKYDNYNIIQRIISKALVREIKTKASTILELGCGSGQIYREISWKVNKYKAIDFSQNMCNIHPKANNLELLCFDFDSEEFWNNIKNDKYDLILSSSALQWSKDFKKLINNLSSISKEINIVLFTSNTFKRIYEITKQRQSILSQEEILDAFNKFKIKSEVLNYNLIFENKKELFKYIKNSGVQGEIKLSYKEAKKLYKNYDIDYLEFEVIFLSWSSDLDF